MGLEEEGLALELGLSSTPPEGKPKKSAGAGAALVREHEPSLALTLSGETYDLLPPVRSDERKGKSIDLYRQDSGASSFSSVKRERAINGGDEAEETERVSSRVSDEDDDGSNARKKLRLSKAQSALLEESFKQHSTLNPIQKQDLSRELKLTPRQVEVWFQNRRARTKLKQTEVDCDFLKKLCESLTDENRRLQKELQELKAIHSAQPLYMQIPAATLTMCPSCERIASASAPAVVPEAPAKSSLIMAAAAAAPKPNLFNPSVSSLLINH